MRWSLCDNILRYGWKSAHKLLKNSFSSANMNYKFSFHGTTVHLHLPTRTMTVSNDTHDQTPHAWMKTNPFGIDIRLNRNMRMHKRPEIRIKQLLFTGSSPPYMAKLFKKAFHGFICVFHLL